MRKTIIAVILAACVIGYLAWRYNVMAEHLVAESRQAVGEVNP